MLARATGSHIDDGWNDEREDGAPGQNDSTPDIDGASHESDNGAGGSGAEQNDPAETNCVERPDEQVGEDTQTDDDASESEDADDEHESTDCGDETQSVGGNDGLKKKILSLMKQILLRPPSSKMRLKTASMTRQVNLRAQNRIERTVNRTKGATEEIEGAPFESQSCPLLGVYHHPMTTFGSHNRQNDSK